MKSISFIIKSLSLFNQHNPWKLLLIFGLTLFLGIFSGFSIVLLIPLLQLLDIGEGETANGPALFIQNMTDRMGIDLNIETILGIYVVLLTFTALLHYWKSIVDARYQQTLISGLRRRLFRKIILADWPSLNTRSKTSHLQVLTHEVPNLAEYIFYYLRLLTTLIITVSYLAYAMAVSARFTLLIIGVGAVLFVLLRAFFSRSLRLGEGHVASYSRLLKYIDDFWQTVKIAKVHSSEDFYYNKFDEASTSLLDIEYRMQRNYSLPQLIYRIAGIAVLVVIVYVGYRLGQVPLTSFFILILLFAKIFPQMNGISTDISVILSNVASVRLVMQLDGELPDPGFQPRIGGESLALEKEIRIENLRFAYPGGEPLFADLCETIPAHSITGILGESGLGKTTLIDLIAGLQKPDAGRILVDGSPLDAELLPRWQNSIGYLPQDPFFIDGTLRENLVWDSRGEIGDPEILRVLEQVNAIHLLKRFSRGLDTYVVNYPYVFSGGERQRLALARVLLRKPRLLLLDEATSSLDPENERQIMEVIAGLKERVTVVVVTHRASLLEWFDGTIRL